MGKRKAAPAKGKEAQKAGQEENTAKKPRREPIQYKNRQRTLIFSSRGTSHRDRHLLNDLRKMLPASKTDVKLDAKDKISVINEICEMKSCNNCVYFETRRRSQLYMWLAKYPTGPSIKCFVKNVHTMDELRMTGNCLKGSRPILSFDNTFETAPHWGVCKEILSHIFSVPKMQRGSKPFIDHVFSFHIVDNKIWFRNFQIIFDDADPVVAQKKSQNGKKAPEVSLVEIGPRFVLDIVKIFSGSFGGSTLYENPDFITPAKLSAIRKSEKAGRYIKRKNANENKALKKLANQLEPGELDDVFES
eukprot:TRINITY_DN1028_c0_g1_i2.p1 TRINITY_DN1028_c0_g1~~TRINITY_DN1028_c0_g1_i2.p1  ORF type:complete len:304 (+),score=70.18 TRINITY_DN1028_c0_g1_i2:122-1033(+)